jgi:small-conductance mechanosensitive channel
MDATRPEAFKNYTRRCVYIFITVLCGIVFMVAASFAPLGHRSYNIALVLAAAGFNAFIVAGFLMHLLSERRLIYAVLTFTVFFVTCLMCLTLYAARDVPAVLGH